MHALNLRRSRLHLAPFAEKLVIYELANPFPPPPPPLPSPTHSYKITLIASELVISMEKFHRARPQPLVHFLFWRAFVYNLEFRSSSPTSPFFWPSIDETTPFRSVNAQFRGNNMLFYTESHRANTSFLRAESLLPFNPLEKLWCTYRVIFRILRSRPVSRVASLLSFVFTNQMWFFSVAWTVYRKWRELVHGS